MPTQSLKKYRTRHVQGIIHIIHRHMQHRSRYFFYGQSFVDFVDLDGGSFSSNVNTAKHDIIALEILGNYFHADSGPHAFLCGDFHCSFTLVGCKEKKRAALGK